MSTEIENAQALETKKSNRGVKPGIKRGSYKKRTYETKEVVPQTNEIVAPETKNEADMHNSFQDSKITTKSGEDKYLNFLSEYGTPKEIKDEPIINNDEPAKPHENKSYDFTGHATNAPTQDANGNMEGIKKNNAMLVNGYMLLSLCDFIIPNGLLFVWKMVDERVAQIKVADVKLDKDQKAALKESADQVAMYIFQKVNPLVIFGVGMAVMYASNIQSALSEIPKPEYDYIQQPQ